MEQGAKNNFNIALNSTHGDWYHLHWTEYSSFSKSDFSLTSNRTTWTRHFGDDHVLAKEVAFKC